MNHLSELENQSIYIIREAYKQFRKIAVLWSIGKDSTTNVWLARKAFFGKLPFPVLHIDTGNKFPEMYTFRDHWAKEWGLELLVAKNEEAMARGIVCGRPGVDAMACSHELKTVALQQAIRKYHFEALIVGIRRDEHGIRAKERVFSPRDQKFRWDYKNQPAELWDQYRSHADDQTHIRIHPLLAWTEMDIWQYVQREHIPVNPLYFARNGKRYRSLGCQSHTNPVESNADTIDAVIEELKTTKIAERSGRSQDKEQADVMQRLRALGYM
ncbi:MAG: sulfate adenylyltransferase subunit 2 [Candidatus Kerfeldbacteria bacterium]|nr:sulfate adenylyltransferase subunit 2 [Candidatus Kerfeldbacteria bacterium]